MFHPTDKAVADVEHVSPPTSPGPHARPHQPQPKGPGHIAIHEVDEKELDDADSMLAHDTEFTDAEYARLRWKLDAVLMPILMVMYGLQYADKTALSQGVVFHLREDTGLVGNQYANLTTFFYVGYMVAQLPMGYLMQRFRLGRALSFSIVAWGAMVMLLGACNNYWQLSVVRVLLGWFESVVTPGFAVLTASWYLRREQTLRQCMYYTMTPLTPDTVFAIVFGIANYKLAETQLKNGGLAAWRVINLFLGGLTIGMGLVSLLFIGTPAEVWWLSKREKRMARARIASNGTGGGENHPWRWGQVRECFRDPQFYMALLANVLCTIPNGAVTTFNTLLMQSFGYGPLDSLIWMFPSYAVGSGYILIASVIVYYFPRARFPICLVVQCQAIFVFLFVGLGAKNPSISNHARFIVFCWNSIFTTPMFMVWPLMTANIAGRTKKTFFTACSLCSYCLGNILGSQVMRPNDAPLYLTGLTAIAICMAVNLVNFSAWWFYYTRTNRKREEAFVASGVSEEQKELENRIAGETDLTDRENPHFRYMA